MKMYKCPMHPEVVDHKKSNCPKCGMYLELEESHKSDTQDNALTIKDYTPLIVVISLISIVSIVTAVGHHSNIHTILNNFMAGFFITFAGFKLLDLKQFAQGYSMYDLLASRVLSYGYVYPFIELFLGLAYLTAFQPVVTNVATLVVMSFSGIGVALKLRKKEKFRCACLGTAINLPLTKITFFEDFGMAIMALYMLAQISNLI